MGALGKKSGNSPHKGESAGSKGRGMPAADVSVPGTRVLSESAPGAQLCQPGAGVWKYKILI